MMPTFGLIIAIENYPDATQMAKQLDGTNTAALEFAQWLADKKGIPRPGDAGFDPERFFCCAGDGVACRTHGTKRQEVLDTVTALILSAKDRCEELFVFLSGHGFCYPRTELVQEDILACSDFKDQMTGGGACLKVQELMQLLVVSLGPGTQYYFYDACRTEIAFGAVRPAETGLAPPPSDLGRPGRAIIFSVEQGQAARVNSGFSRHLVNGLNGRGRAKDWHNEKLYVKFDFLWKYIEAQSKRKLSQQIGESEGLILEISPIQPVTFNIEIQHANPVDPFEAVVRLRNMEVRRENFIGQRHAMTVDLPGLYAVDVKFGVTSLKRLEPPAGQLCELYDSGTVLKFRMVGGGLESLPPEGAPPEDDARVTVFGAQHAAVQISGPGFHEFIADDHRSVSRQLQPGNYHISVLENGQTVAGSDVLVESGKPLELDPVRAATTPVHEAILARIEAPDWREVWFSESLGGPTVDRDLGLWLSYLGASRIVRQSGDFSKLSKVPLQADFRGVAPGQSAVYLLASLEDQPSPYFAGLGKNPEWAEMSPVDGVPGLFEFARDLPPGPFLISFQTLGSAPLTAASYALPDRATLLTLTPNTGSMPIQLYQFLLPIWSLIDHLPGFVRQKIDTDPLKVVRFATHCQRLFGQEHSLADAYGRGGPDAADGHSRTAYYELIYGKWLDPLVALIAANDLLRRGVLNPASPVAEFRGLLPIMVRNLREYFRGIPDIEALALAIREPYEPPAAPPLLADSLAVLAPGDRERCLPFSDSLRIFNTPWIAWAQAVPPR